jgi:hypothetical protein
MTEGQATRNARQGRATATAKLNRLRIRAGAADAANGPRGVTAKVLSEEVGAVRANNRVFRPILRVQNYRVSN